MIKVLRIEEVRKADLATIEKQGIPSIELMERAAKSCTAWLMENIPPGLSFTICCGKGNNGGDGLAIARLLWEKGKEVSVYIIEETGSPSPDFLKNLQQWESLSPSGTKTIAVVEEIPIFPPETIIIDAIFGSGLNRSPEGLALETIKKINSSANKIIAIDIPSGLFTDKHTEDLNNVICAGFTLTFQVLKQAFVYPEYEQQIGEWHVLDIGLDSEVIQNAPARAFLPDIQDIHALLPYRPAHGHKGTFGHALLLAGSYGKAGAAILAAGACLRSGTGLVTVRTPARCVLPVQAALPEAMCSPDEEQDFLSDIVKIEKYNAIGVGPGIGIDKQTGNVIKRLLQDSGVPLVLDADALNLIAENPTWLQFLPAGTILTPHPGEFARLAGRIGDPFERTNKQLEMAEKYNCYIILKGKFTAIACPDRQLFFNPTGNNGMAKGGSGDILTGILTGLLAQGLSPMRAALAGTYIHGLAGDLCSAEIHPTSMKSGDIIDYLPEAIRAVS